MTVIEQSASSQIREIERGVLHYAGVDAPMISLCGIRVSGPRITSFSQDEVCDECVDKMLDWVSWCHRNDRKPVGEPWAFRASDDS